MSAGAHPRFREVPPLRLHLAIVQVHRFRDTRGSLYHIPDSQDGVFTDAAGFATLISDPPRCPAARKWRERPNLTYKRAKYLYDA